MDRCHYCGLEYHPMPVWRLHRDRSRWRVTTPFEIHVCALCIIESEDGAIDIEQCRTDCMDRAEADGYEHRPDLTPCR